MFKRIILFFKKSSSSFVAMKITDGLKYTLPSLWPVEPVEFQFQEMMLLLVPKVGAESERNIGARLWSTQSKGRKKALERVFLWRWLAGQLKTAECYSVEKMSGKCLALPFTAAWNETNVSARSNIHSCHFVIGPLIEYRRTVGHRTTLVSTGRVSISRTGRGRAETDQRSHLFCDVAVKGTASNPWPFRTQKLKDSELILVLVTCAPPPIRIVILVQSQS